MNIYQLIVLKFNPDSEQNYMADITNYWDIININNNTYSLNELSGFTAHSNSTLGGYWKYGTGTDNEPGCFID